MFGLDLSLELINMVITAAGVVLHVALNMSKTLALRAVIDFDGSDAVLC